MKELHQSNIIKETERPLFQITTRQIKLCMIIKGDKL